MNDNDIRIPPIPNDDVAEMLELIRMMLADSPFPVEREGFPQGDRLMDAVA